MKIGGKMIKLQVLRANQGDCIILSYGIKATNNHIIIDGGMGKECYRQLQKFLCDIKLHNENVELLILTHFDKDHISGFLDIMKDDSIDISVIKMIWFNYGTQLSNELKKNKSLQLFIKEASKQTSVAQGEEFYIKIQKKGILLNSYIKELDCYEVRGAKITILSPSINQLEELIDEIGTGDGICIELEENNHLKQTAALKNDYNDCVDDLLRMKYSEKGVSVANRSSIAFLFEYDDKKIMILGDAVSSQIIKALKTIGYSKYNPIKLHFCKIAHHGSSHNTSPEFIQMIDCSRYIISSNWTCNRPSKTCLSRIIANSDKPITFYCNYQYKSIFTEDEKIRYDVSFELIDGAGILL